ncbi:MAG: PilT/PilU family type 4a pilus ATPase [Phycisphaerales bacterium]|nr:PilT/PilU family type 4a pilus ATPase [Phycisphaerales bacterium]
MHLSSKSSMLAMLLEQARAIGASDVLLVAGAAPSAYVHSRLKPLATKPLTAEQTAALLKDIISPAQLQHLTQQRDLDLSVALSSVGRWRVNVHYQRDSLAAAFRFIPSEIPSLESLNLPPILQVFTRLPRGLVLVTGGTGHGKSTTLAALVERINRDAALHVITVEDPIEYEFTARQSIIEQREIGIDSPSFASALRHVLRQKPDVIVVGEMRDLETIRIALTAAETGHLVLATLHTISAAQTIERIVDVFEPAQQPQIRTQLSGALQAVICQTLLPRTDVEGVAPAVEILVNTPAIARAIRDGETHLINGMIETGAAVGMMTLDAAILELERKGWIDAEQGLSRAQDPQRLLRMLNRAGEGPAEHSENGEPRQAAPALALAGKGKPATSAQGAKPWE